MVITCPACSARYRLNPTKIKGRGAKITCPKCAHVFVVFADGRSEDAPGSAEEPDEDNFDGFLGKSRETTTGAFKAVGMSQGELSGNAGTTGQVRVVAPGPRKTRRVVAAITTGSNLRAVPKNLAPSTPDFDDEPEPGPDAPAADTAAADLDFRSVGISTWKVKVKIGLIYDFSDISTLKKYLADKKVTPDDLISHNGKDWSRIGDIPDLDTHFIEIWTLAKADFKEDDSKPKKTVRAAASAEIGDTLRGAGADTGAFAQTGGMRSPSARTGSSTAISRTTSTRTSRGGGSRASQEPAKPRTSSVWVLLVGGLLLILVGYFVIERMSGNRAAELSRERSTVAAEPSTAPSQDDFARELEEKMRLERERIAQENAATARQDDEEARRDSLPLDERGLVPVNPGRSAVSPPVAQNTPYPQARPRYEAPTAAGNTGSPAASSTGTGVVRQGADPGASYYSAGLKALNSGNYGNAKKMFDLAIAKSPSVGKYHDGLGQAYKALGDAQAAAASFDRAKALTNSAKASQGNGG